MTVATELSESDVGVANAEFKEKESNCSRGDDPENPYFGVERSCLAYRIVWFSTPASYFRGMATE